jgi:hypothetical protein
MANIRPDQSGPRIAKTGLPKVVAQVPFPSEAESRPALLLAAGNDPYINLWPELSSRSRERNRSLLRTCQSGRRLAHLGVGVGVGDGGVRGEGPLQGLLHPHLGLLLHPHRLRRIGVAMPAQAPPRVVAAATAVVMAGAVVMAMAVTHWASPGPGRRAWRPPAPPAGSPG